MPEPYRLTLHPESKEMEPISTTAEGDRVLRVGRTGEVDVTVPDQTVSASHAELSFSATEGWRVRDASSRHGTFVNWMRLDDGEQVRLEEGDRLEFGGAIFIVRLAGPSIPRPTPPPRTESSNGSISDDDFKTRGSLLLRLKDDDDSVRELSWSDFYARYQPIIAGFARRAGCPVSAIEDIVHEVMTGFFKASERFEYDPRQGRFRGYLKTCTINALRARHRKERDKVQIDSEWLEVKSAASEIAWADEWLSSIVVRALDHVRRTTNIEEKSWEAFELYGRRGVPIDEVSRQLDMRPDAIRKAKSRIAKLVREEIERLRAEE